MDHVQIDVLPSEAKPETLEPHLHSTIEERSKAEKIIARASIPPIMLEENATVSPGDLELVKIKIDQENHADMDTSEAGPSFGREWGSPKRKENAEIVPAPAPVDPSEAEPSPSEPWSSSKLKGPEEIGSTSGDFYKPVSSDTDNVFERFQPETWKIKLYRVVASGDIKSFSENYEIDWRNRPTRMSPEANGALHVAAQYKHVDMAKAIMDLEPGLVNSRNMNGDLPLHIAARVGCVDISRVLIGHMDYHTLETENEEGDTALHNAVRGAHLEVVKLLVENPNLTRIENKIGESPLFLAVDKWHFDIARIIFTHPECSIRGRDSMNVLHAAIIRLGKEHQLRGFRPITEILYAVLIDPILSSRRLPLIPLMPVIDCYPPGSTIDSRQHRKHFADYVKFVKEVSRRHPSAVSEADKFGLTPFHYAAHYGCLDIFEFFLEADDLIAYQRDELEGMSAVHIAARNGCVEIIRKLINKFPDAWELLNDRGMTALHVASESGQQNVVDYLLKDHGFEGVINKKDKDGNTPLHLASIQGNHRILVKLADDERVDGSAINNKGFTAVDIVQSSSKFTNSEKAYISFRLKNRGSLLTLKEEVRQMNESEDKPVKEIDKAPEEEKDSQSNGNGMYKDDMYVVVATLIASVTFGAALQIPGGYKSEDPGRGSATVIKQLMFNIFVLADCFSFALSSGSIFVHFWASVEKSSTVAKKFRQDARILTNLSIGGMVVAFTAGIHVALGPSPTLWTASFGLCIFFLWGPMLLFNRIGAMIIKKSNDQRHGT